MFLALLLAVQDGSFPGGNPPELEQLLRVLAYVRKDDDAIPDYQSNGYLDDHLEVRTAARALHELLTRFKLWRLRHEVPKQWRRFYAENSHRAS